MKRFALFGSYPYSGGWNDYMFEFDTAAEAHAVAIEQLKLGCDAHLVDEQTGEQVQICLRRSERKRAKKARKLAAKAQHES